MVFRTYTYEVSDWARVNGISYKTAWLWWKRGKLPVPAHQTPTGTILVDVPKRKEAGAVLYARVSSADQKADLDRQVARLAAFAAEHGIRVPTPLSYVTQGGAGQQSSCTPSD